MKFASRGERLRSLTKFSDCHGRRLVLKAINVGEWILIYQ